MKKEWIKAGLLFLITVGAVFWALNYLFLSGQTAQKSKASGETMALAFDPASITVGANQDFTTTLTVKPSANLTMRGYRVKVVFDKAKLQLKTIEYKLGATSSGLGDTTSSVSTANQNGSALLVGEIQNSTGQVVTGNTAITLANLTFSNLSSSSTSLTVQTADAMFYGFGSDLALYEVPTTATAQLDINGGGPTGTPTPTITPGGPTLTPTPTIVVTGNVKVDFKLKFQGITTKPVDARNSMNVKFTLSGADLSSPLVKTGAFAADAIGIWSGRVGFDLTSPSGKKYTLYVKGPRHVQKKVCDIAPTETNAGTYSCSTPNFTLAIGENTRNLSNILLLSGDIYGPDKVQDGVVNSVDLSYVKNNLNKTDAITLAVCDINLDGKCDTQDYSLIISALSIKSDEQ